MDQRGQIQRVCVTAKPRRDNSEYFEWQTASVCMFVPEDDHELALHKAKEELQRRQWQFLAYEDRSTLIEERVKSTGGEVWDAYQYAKSGRIFFCAFPHHFGANDPQFRPLRPARITEGFMDQVLQDAGGRRLFEDEVQADRRNADYLLGDFIFELKDLQEEVLEKGSHQARLAELFRPYHPGAAEVTIDPSVLSKPDYLAYLDIMSRPIKSHIRSARNQIKSTKEIVGRRELLGGIVMLKTGFGSFPHHAFADQVERYAAKDSSQFEAVVSISVWCETNGFDSWAYYGFSPEKPTRPEVVAIKKAFDSRFEAMMTAAVTGTRPASVEEVTPVRPIAFEADGVDFLWLPPRILVPSR